MKETKPTEARAYRIESFESVTARFNHHHSALMRLAFDVEDMLRVLEQEEQQTRGIVLVRERLRVQLDRVIHSAEVPT